MMSLGCNDKDERREQKEMLRHIYQDYDARRHDAFVFRYNQEMEAQLQESYWMNRAGVYTKKGGSHEKTED